MSEEKKLVIESRCPECGYKVRGKNHVKGDHHKSGGRNQKKK